VGRFKRFLCQNGAGGRVNAAIRMSATAKQLGRYEILDELGRGAMGVVYKARDPIIDRVVALKTIDFALTGAAAESFEQRFFQEARAAGRLNHPNIVTIYDAGQADGVAYIAMEFLDGTSLRQLLDEPPPLGIARAVEVAGQVARGLAYAHEQGVIHRDIKPANIIVLRNKRPKITDFGIARLSEADGRSGERAGSPKYMAPEQIRADATIDGRADLFSLGAVLYEMLTGRAPFTGETVHEIMEQVLGADPPPPGSVNARVPPELDAIVMRMLAKRPADRFPSARSLFRELRRVEERLEERTTREAADEAEVVAAVAPTSNDGDKTLVLAAAPAAPALRALRSTRRMVALVAAGLILAGLALIPLRLQFSDANARRTEVAAAPPPAVIDTVPAPASGPAQPEPPPAIAPPPEPVKVAPPPPPKRVAAPHPPAKPPAPKPVPAVAPPPPAQVAAAPPPKPAAPAAAQTAKLLLYVTPRGDVYIDGKHAGTAPPLTVIELPPGRHKVEIRNSTQLPYLSHITLQAGASHRVQHAFVE
jgi:serine/threonine-protein kinase